MPLGCRGRGRPRRLQAALLPLSLLILLLLLMLLLLLLLRPRAFDEWVVVFAALATVCCCWLLLLLLLFGEEENVGRLDEHSDGAVDGGVDEFGVVAVVVKTVVSGCKPRRKHRTRCLWPVWRQQINFRSFSSLFLTRATLYLERLLHTHPFPKNGF